MPVATFKLVLEYDGAGFAGWQLQREGQRTVQGELQAALAPLALGPVGAGPLRIMGAGRTDAGVHAEGQVASVRLETRLDPETLQRALNAKLPADLVVLGCEASPPGFDARRDALSKHYRYRIWNHRLRSPLRSARSHQVREPLDRDSMEEAAAHLAGRHDFACFQASGSDVPHTIRTLTRCQVAGAPGAEIVLDLEGDGFLRHMVRNVAGTLIEVGLGKRAPGSLPALLEGRDRSLAGPTAPAAGLTLMAVRYPDPGPEGTPG